MTDDTYHPITLEPSRRRWRAKFAGHVIADTDEALLLREPGDPLRIYFPRGDVAMEFMGRTDKRDHSPHKGDASFFTMVMDGQFGENAAWSYEHPLPGLEAIAGRIAFFTHKVEVYEVTDERVKTHPRNVEGVGGRPVSAVIQHTDSGSGASQREHWEPNVDEDEAR